MQPNQDVAWIERARRAGRTRADRDVVEVQVEDQPLAIHRVEGQVGSVRQPGAAVTVEVERSQSTFTSSDGDQYEDGYTITGVVTGSKQAVELFTLNKSSAEVRDLRRGDSWSTSVSVSRWDTLYNRLVLLQTG